MKLSESQRESLKAAVSRYHASLPGSVAEKYLDERGLTGFEGIDRFRLGYVEDPLPEHEAHRGKLAIPYLRWHPRHGWSCVSIRFRSLDGSEPKYATMAGDKPRLFNTQALNAPGSEVGIAEGELDAITATLAGLPTVGIPGANIWQPYWDTVFQGYRRVHVLTDGDKPGENMGRTIASRLPNARIVPCPDGEDINSVYTSRGADDLVRMWSE